MKKSRLIIVTSLFVVSLLLAMAVGTLAAPGDPTFTLVGFFTTVSPGNYSVNGQAFVLDPANVCVPAAPCPPADGSLVEVAGYINTINLVSTYYATTITLKPVDTVFTFTGELMSFTDTTWVIGPNTFDVTAATLPPFKAVGDTVKVTYTVEAVTGKYKASLVELIATKAGNTYTYSGELKALPTLVASGPLAGQYLWMIGDYTFYFTSGAEGVVDEFGAFIPGATANVTFTIVAGNNIASAITVTNVPMPVAANKNENSRCANRLDHVQLEKLAAKFMAEFGIEVNPEWLYSYFCAGYGWGEIKQAYELASKWEGDSFCVAQLLTLRSEGQGWGNIKKMTACPVAPGTEPTEETGEEQTEAEASTEKGNNGQGNPPVDPKTNNGKGQTKEKSNNGNAASTEKSNNGKNK